MIVYVIEDLKNRFWGKGKWGPLENANIYRSPYDINRNCNSLIKANLINRSSSKFTKVEAELFKIGETDE